MALDATIGGAAANSYVTQAAASSYFADRLEVTDWTDATSGEKDAALIMATQRLDAEAYQGARVYNDQRLQWPRYGTYDRDGWMISSDIIPEMVKQATYELALEMLKDPTMLEDTGLEQFQNVRIGSLDITPRAVTPAGLPAYIKRLLAPVRLAGGGTPVVRA